MSVAIVGELIPIVAIVLGIGIGMLAIYLDFRKKRELFQLYHAERMAAIEKGIELPPLPADLLREPRNPEARAARHRRVGLVLVFVGVTVGLALWGTKDPDVWWSLVPVGWGLALLLSSYLESRERAAQRRVDNPQPPS
jgi:hypothetical protein